MKLQPWQELTIFPAEQTAIVSRSVKGLVQGGVSVYPPKTAGQILLEDLLSTSSGTTRATVELADGPRSGQRVGVLNGRFYCIDDKPEE